MALTTATITGKFTLPDGVTPLVVQVTMIPTSTGGTLQRADTGDIIGGAFTATGRKSDGLLSITIPQLPQASLVPSGAQWRATFTIVDPPWSGPVVSIPSKTFDLTANTTWSTIIIDTTGAPAPQSIADAAAASAASAAASASAAAASAASIPTSWRPNTAVAVGVVWVAPDGTTINRNTAGTTRGSYDATEEALWTPTLALAGTGDRKALDARYALLSRTYDIRDYQAVSGGPDIATATNNAITAANAAGGGTVLVPASAAVWFFGSAIAMKANVSLLVMGTLRALSTHTGAGVTVSDASNTTIYGVGTIDMNKAATTNGAVASAQQGIYVVAPTATSAVTRTTIRDVMVVNCWQRAIHAQANLVAGATITDLAIDHVTVSNCGGNGIYVQGIGNTDHTTPSTSRGIAVTNSTITGVGIAGITFVGVSDINCDRNKLDGVGATSHGICFGSSTTTAHCTDFTATANTVRGFTGSISIGIVASTNATRFALVENIVDGCTLGISVDPEDAAAVAVMVDVKGALIGNTATNSTASHGINARISKYLRIIGNHSSGNFLSGIQVSNSLGCVLDDNTTVGNGVHGIALAGTNAGTGDHRLGVNTSTGNNTRNVGGNNFSNDPSAPIASRVASTAVFATSTP